jgi:hypothetical protein
MGRVRANTWFKTAFIPVFGFGGSFELAFLFSASYSFFKLSK